MFVMDVVDENWKTVADCLKSILCKLLVDSSYADMPANVTAPSVPPARRQDLVRHALPCQESADELYAVFSGTKGRLENDAPFGHYLKAR